MTARDLGIFPTVLEHVEVAHERQPRMAAQFIGHPAAQGFEPAHLVSEFVAARGLAVGEVGPDDAQRAAWLQRLGASPSDLAYEAAVEAALDGLASHVEAHLDVDGIIANAR